MFLFDVVKKLEEFEVPYAIVGGHAVALHGAIRGTVDIDFITEWQLENLQKIELVMAELGLIPRLPITSIDLFKNRDTYILEKNLILSIIKFFKRKMAITRPADGLQTSF